MRHYEIVFLVHPDQSGQVSQMVERYQNLIKNNGGTIHRFEDWGRRQLAYSINKIYKAHYILMNVEMDKKTHDELEHTFQYNDAILRHLILKQDAAITNPSAIIQQQQNQKAMQESTSSASDDRAVSTGDDQEAEAESSEESVDRSENA